MASKHDSKFIIYIILGLLLITSGIIAICYGSYRQNHPDDWIFWACVSVVTINSGLVFFGSSLIHKVKSDLIRRQKQKAKFDRKFED